MAFKLEHIQTKNISQKGRSDIGTLLKKEITLFGPSFNNKKKQAFYREIAVLLKAGITIKDGLALIIDSIKKKQDKDLILVIQTDVINGLPFSKALSVSKIFSEYEYYSLKIGEETGTLAQICNELAVFYERKNEQKRIVIGALTYPAIVMCTALLVIIFMLNYVVPMFQDIFRQNNMELPLVTRVVVKLSGIVKTYGFFLLLIVGGFILSARLLKKNISYKRFMGYLALRIPIFGSFIAKVYLAQFTQAVSLLTTAKVPLLNSIQLVSEMIGFMPLKDALEEMEYEILQGNSLSASMMKSAMFDNRIIALVKVAEETNQNEYVFKQLNEQYNQEVILQSKMMTTLLEPLIIVIVGVIVAILLISMYLPMFQLSSAIG